MTIRSTIERVDSSVTGDKYGVGDSDDVRRWMSSGDSTMMDGTDGTVARVRFKYGYDGTTVSVS